MTDLVKRLRERADLARHSLEGGGWRYFSAADIANYDQAASHIETLEERNRKLEEALSDLLSRYKALADSGDAGFWDCEEEREVISARAALSSREG